MYTPTPSNKWVDCLLHRKYVANDTYHEDFNSLLGVLESYCGAYKKELVLIKAYLEALGIDDPDEANYDDRAMAEAVVGDKMLEK